MSKIPDLLNLTHSIAVRYDKNNLTSDFEFRKKLESLGFKWRAGENPTEVSCSEYGDLYYLIESNNTIGCTSTPKVPTYDIYQFITIDKEYIKQLIEEL